MTQPNTPASQPNKQTPAQQPNLPKKENDQQKNDAKTGYQDPMRKPSVPLSSSKTRS